jgi:hypothetical protein
MLRICDCYAEHSETSDLELVAGGSVLVCPCTLVKDSFRRRLELVATESVQYVRVHLYSTLGDGRLKSKRLST